MSGRTATDKAVVLARGLGTRMRKAGAAALRPEQAADEFLRDWTNSYAQSLPERAGGAEFLLTAAGPAAFDLA
ncbi:MAG TPA: hypothetical protein VM389_15390 [Phycisphaerae bacterium]|nr:hypothetical protein [Phycisphaerae bacterium]